MGANKKISIFHSCLGFAIAGMMMAVSCNTKASPPPVVYKNNLRVIDTAELKLYKTALSAFFDSLLNDKGFSGGILVAKNGEVLYEHYQGNIFGKNDQLINNHTTFHIASTSKTFTSISIFQLESEGKLSIEDKLTDYFPDFPYKEVTIRNLLNHSSGVPYYANFLPKYRWDKKVTVSNQDVLNVLVKNKPSLDFPTGSRFKYCNTNFVLLALLVEKVSGVTFPYYVKEHIFNVAGMSDSYILTPFNKADYMPSWTESGRIYNYEYLDGLYGDKNVFTTCRDLLKYDSAIRNGLIINPDILQKAWQPNFQDKSYNDPWEYYGLGWRLKIFDENLKIPYHNGWWHGNNSVFQRLIADTAVIIVTGNRMNKKIYASAYAANFFRPYYPDKPVHPLKQAELKEDNIEMGGNEQGLPKTEKLGEVPVLKKETEGIDKKPPVL